MYEQRTADHRNNKNKNYFGYGRNLSSLFTFLLFTKNNNKQCECHLFVQKKKNVAKNIQTYIILYFYITYKRKLDAGKQMIIIFDSI